MRVEVIVLICYFIGMIGIGIYWNKRAKKSEDFLLGRRSTTPNTTTRNPDPKDQDGLCRHR